MRFRSVAALAAAAALACAPRSASVSPSPAATCPYQVLVTVSNPHPIAYDVYLYAPGKPAAVVGEILPGSTVTFQVPGEGRGFVRLQRPPGDRTQIRYAGRELPPIRIRMHCPGS